MTPDEWDAGHNPRFILFTRLGPNEAERRCRLFAVACCRWVWPSLTHGRCRKAVEVAEQFADGIATEAELHRAKSNAGQSVGNIACRFGGPVPRPSDLHRLYLVGDACHPNISGFLHRLRGFMLDEELALAVRTLVPEIFGPPRTAASLSPTCPTRPSPRPSPTPPTATASPTPPVPAC